VVILALITQPYAAEPQTNPSQTVTISTVGTSTRAKTITYNVEGTHGPLESYQEIRVVGQRSQGEWLVSPPATLGPSTWQADLSTTYSEPIVLKAVIVGLIEHCGFPCLVKTAPGDPEKSLATDGWNYRQITAASAKQTVKPR
jgi:hypothetical protein